jgi:CheY-like chemotaxis protein/anti-sigma regulatory factor (Ser/Thr protein kinase)
MQDAAALFAPMAENKGITFDLDPPEKDVRLWADRTGVDRMLANLLSNAIKFTSEGSVTLSGKRTADAVEVRVADTGAGMDESFQEYLFDAFRQESSGLSRLYEGTGLGLTITRRLAEVMNVAISVETEKGEGSTFFLRFPKPERRARPSRMPDEPLPQFEIKLGRLLAVEDNDDTRRLLERLLSKNWTPTVVSTPAEALEAAAETAFDAVLLDINLGADLDGVDVMRRLRKDERYAEVPFVAVTAYAMPGDEEGFADVGFDAYLGKPFTQKELLRVLQQSAKEKR